MIKQQASIQVFGVRHLSPGAAWHVRRFLDKVRPSIVLIEGIADATGLIKDMLHKKTRPPIALLAYTESLPVKTIVSPFASYSPEYQALLWAKEHKIESRFIDLPSENFLAIERRRMEKLEARMQAELARLADDEAAFEAARETRDAQRQTDPEANEDEEFDEEALQDQDKRKKKDPEIINPESQQYRPEMNRGSIYEQIASLSGEPDYETYWERQFEQNLGEDVYHKSAYAFGAQLREMELKDRDPNGRNEEDLAETIAREAYMRRLIHEAISEGHQPERIAVIVGAYHAPVMNLSEPAMTDKELAELPKETSKLTLMPYSYFKLSSQSGYGAGNHAPAYFEMMWQCLQEEDPEKLPLVYLSQLAGYMRAHGTFRSTAEVIESVRLARTIAALRDSLAPTLKELQDAALTLLGRGEVGAIADARARAEVGTAIGSLPAGVSQTSIQEDFNQKLAELKLNDYRSTVAQDLDLDLRENRRAKTEAAAYRDLNRSAFLHQLSILGIEFAHKQERRQQGANWAERWQLKWTPEAEISLVESVLLGETIELATGFKFKTRLDQCTTIAEASAIVREASECLMMEVMQHARQVLQALAAESTDFVALADSADELKGVVRYGDVRRYDATPMLPLIQQFCVEGALLLEHAANCDHQTAQRMLPAMARMNTVMLEFSELVDEGLWLRALQSLAARDDLNPILSGYAAAILLERGEMDDDELTREVSRRLSPGSDADLGAGWFEGLSKRNRYALLSRLRLWTALAEYIESLEDEEFMRALVFLRRSFGHFSPQERRQITENLSEIWGVNADAFNEVIEAELSEQEQQSLDSLDDFDFDDL